MTTPNVDVDFGALPEIRSYAATTGNGHVTLGSSAYLELPAGVSTIMVGSQQAALTVHLTTGAGNSYRYRSISVDAGKTVSLTNVAVPEGETRYLNIWALAPGDVGATIITYPLA